MSGAVQAATWRPSGAGDGTSSGLDASAVAVSQARVRFGERFRQGDLASMAYPERTFDTVLFSQAMLEHLHGPLPLLKEVRRILIGRGGSHLCPMPSLEARPFGRWWFPMGTPPASVPL